MASSQTPPSSDETSSIDSHPDANSNPDTATGIEHLEQLSAAFPCEITATGSVAIDRSLDISGGKIIEGDWEEPHWREPTDISYTCHHCREDFEDKAAAIAHLKQSYRRWRQQYRLPPGPDAPADGSRPATIEWESERRTVETPHRLSVRIIPSQDSLFAKPVDSIERLTPSIRHSYDLPSGYSFADWEPMEGGRLTFGDGTPRIGGSALSRAIHYVSGSSGYHYEPDLISLFDLGDFPFLIQGPNGGVLVAPRR